MEASTSMASSPDVSPSEAAAAIELPNVGPTRDEIELQMDGLLLHGAEKFPRTDGFCLCLELLIMSEVLETVERVDEPDSRFQCA